MRKPVIGVTKPYRGGLTQNLAIQLGLRLAGARVVNLTPKSNISFEKLALDGLLISGGTDLHPQKFNSTEIKQGYRYDTDRDEFEMSWVRMALARNMPMLCICRGAQLLNIVLGGTLHTDIARTFESANYPNSLLAKIFFRKKIFVEPGTKLYEILGRTELRVNSMHSQSIDKLGKNLNLTSKEPNGIIQSIEHRLNHFVIGVQFHPEFLLYRKEIRRLFSEFIRSSEQSRDCL